MIGPWLRFVLQISGGKPRSVAVDLRVDVTGRRYPPLEGRMSQARGRPFTGPNELQPAADRALGNSVGAIGWPI